VLLVRHPEHTKAFSGRVTIAQPTPGR
jgi:hypothetical protein